MRPNSASIPQHEDRSDELVVGADNGSDNPAEMKIGMVVGERCQISEEIEEREAAYLANPPSIEFSDVDGKVADIVKDATTSHAKPAR